MNETYVYDPFGRRIKKTVNGITTYFVWDGSQIVAEYSASGIREKRYAYLPMSLNPIQMEDANGIYNIHTDHLDTARFITDTAQKIVWNSKQESFGKMQVNEDPDANGIAVIFNQRFPGQYLDVESGLYQNYFRDYDPSIGRYIQSDPIGLAGGVNTYAYVEGNPISNIDPFGLTAKGNQKLDQAQDTIKERLKDPNLDKKTRNALKEKLKGHEKATGTRHSRMSKDKIKGPRVLIPLSIWDVIQDLCRQGVHTGIGCLPDSKPCAFEDLII